MLPGFILNLCPVLVELWGGVEWGQEPGQKVQCLGNVQWGPCVNAEVGNGTEQLQGRNPTLA